MIFCDPEQVFILHDTETYDFAGTRQNAPPRDEASCYSFGKILSYTL